MMEYLKICRIEVLSESTDLYDRSLGTFKNIRTNRVDLVNIVQHLFIVNAVIVYDLSKLLSNNLDPQGTLDENGPSKHKAVVSVEKFLFAVNH